MSDAAPLLQVERLAKVFSGRAGGLFGRTSNVMAVDDVSFHIRAGDTLALVGESGCGKSTILRLLLHLLEPTSGCIRYEGRDLSGLSRRELRSLRRHFQMVFQDPYSSLSPRERVRDIVAEPLMVHQPELTARQVDERVIEALERVGLGAWHADRYPYQFSGGQRQRIGIARAIVLKPRLIVADEPVSALDVSVQSQVINLLSELQEKLGIAMLIVAHDLSVVWHIADRVAVMYLGRIVEIGDRDAVFERPHHPYTQSLLSAVPRPDPTARRKRVALKGDVPSPTDIPTGCRFRSRCPIAQDVCASVDPGLARVGEDHEAACHFARPFPIPDSAL